MAYVDMEHIKALWERTGDEFTRKAKAVGSILLSGTSLVMGAADGSQLSSVDLGDTFATRSDAISSASISVSGNTITITFYDCEGSYKDEVSFTVS